MSTNPIVILADAIHEAECGCDGAGRSAEERQAKAVAKALTDDAIVANAVQALKDDGWEQTHEGPLGIGTLTDEDLANIARVVLGSVAGR